MSIYGIAWVFEQDIRPSSLKFVLLALADNAGDTGLAWPAVSTICHKTSQDRKTVIGALDILERRGLIQDTGKRTGSTKSVKVYRLNFSEAVPQTGQLSSPVFPYKQSRNSLEAVPFFPISSPENGTQNHKEPKEEPQKDDVSKKTGYSVPSCFEKIDGFTGALAGWIEARKKKRNPPTGYAIQLFINRLSERPQDAVAALELAIERGWATAKWEWFENERNKVNGKTTPKATNSIHGKPCRIV